MGNKLKSQCFDTPTENVYLYRGTHRSPWEGKLVKISWVNCGGRKIKIKQGLEPRQLLKGTLTQFKTMLDSLLIKESKVIRIGGSG